VIFLVAASVAVGLVFGRIPAAVAERVFATDRRPLLVRSDVLRPWAVSHQRPALAIAVQIACGALFGAAAAVIGERWVLAAFVWFVAVSVTLTLTDVDQKLIPNRILYPSYGIAVALLAAGSLLDGDLSAFARGIAGSAGYFAFLLILALIAGEGFGMGDVKLGALLGAFLAYEGWSTLIIGGVGAFLLGGVVSLVLLVLRIKGRRDAIPFGPYLVVGAFIALAWGEAISDWYAG
jgi:leader peptidase (prepilin peptidase)/N-methyltransferase